MHLSSLDAATPAGPWEISVALSGARGVVLGAFPPGCEERNRAFDVYERVEDDQLVTLEVPAIAADAGEQRETLRRVLARVVNAFGTTLPLCLPQDGGAEVPDGY